MREPKRLNKFYEILCDVHQTHFPDWRFGQLMSNFWGWVMSSKKRDMFFPEEDETIALLKEYVSKHCTNTDSK